MMKIEEINMGDILVSTDYQGTGYYLVTKVNRVTIQVKCENGNEIKAYPHVFDRKIMPERADKTSVTRLTR